MAKMELDLAITLAEEKASQAVQDLVDEATATEKLGPFEVAYVFSVHTQLLNGLSALCRFSKARLLISCTFWCVLECQKVADRCMF